MERSRGVTVAVAEVSNEEWLESSSASVAELDDPELSPHEDLLRR